MEEIIQGVGDLLVESVELRETLLLELVVCGKRPEQASGEWGIDRFKQFQKNQADAIAVG
jgi:hypothetical protein